MQYQVRTGPIANDAAPFGPEMVQGVRSDPADLRTGGRFRFAARQGLQLSQTTHVPAAFSPEMSQGATLPPRFRERLPLRTGLQLAQTTPVAAPISIEMLHGAAPVRFREVRPPRIGWLAQTPDVLNFSVEMTQGTTPDRVRATVQRLGWSVSQPTPIDAPASLEMFQGTQPSQPRPPFRVALGWFGWTPEVETLSVEMTQGAVSDRPRLPFRAPHIFSWFIYPDTWEALNVMPEMVQGTRPDRSAPPPNRLGWITATLDVQVLSVEMTQGAQPDRPRLFLAPRLDLPCAQPTPTDAEISVEMLQGWQPARGVDPRLNRESGWQVAQPTHDAAIVSVEMVQGAQPARALVGRLILSSLASPLEVAPFSIEMVQGWQPTQPLQWRAPRLPIPPAQSTHIPAPVSVEMLQGWQPLQSRASQGKVGFIVTGFGPDALQITVRRDLFTIGSTLSFVIGVDPTVGGRGTF